MSRHDDRDRTLALAGLFQAAALADDLARNGRCDERAMQHSLDSLFEFDPESVAAVFGGVEGVAAGLAVLHGQLTQTSQRRLEVARYSIALLHHGDKLRNNPARLADLGKELEALHEKTRQFELGDSSLHAQLARIYQDQISPIEPRIMIRGEPLYLQNPQVAEQIRSLLLAGIRAAILWRQCEGKRWQLLLSRRKVADTAQMLLDSKAD